MKRILGRKGKGDASERAKAFRERMKDDPEFKEKERQRKAEWYQNNKERKAENQRRYVEAKRMQAIQDMAKGLTDKD